MDNETRRKTLVRYYEALNTHDPAVHGRGRSVANAQRERRIVDFLHSKPTVFVGSNGALCRVAHDEGDIGIGNRIAIAIGDRPRYCIAAGLWLLAGLPLQCGGRRRTHHHHPR